MNTDVRVSIEPMAKPASGSAADLDRLGDEIAELSAHLDAASARLLDLIREFDARGGWSNGFSSCAAWLTWRVGLDRGAARERVRVARALGALPLLAQALARGELSYSKVRALTRVAGAGCGPGDAVPARTGEARRRRSRGNAQHGAAAGGRAGSRRRNGAPPWYRSRTPGERYQAVVHVDAPVLADSDAPGQSVLEDGTHVPAETSRRLACDATRVVMQHDVDGHITEVGARTRTIPPALRRALQHRDRGCRFPGCALPFGQGHDIRHWAHGSPTTLSNLALLCRRHRRAVHEEGYQVERQADGDLRFRRPDGRPLPQVPPPAAVPGWLGDRLDVVYAIDVLHPLARPDIEEAAAQPCTAG